MVVGDSEYIMIAQDKVGCLTADGNVDDVDLHRAPKHNQNQLAPYVQGRMQGWVMRVSEHSSAASNTP